MDFLKSAIWCVKKIWHTLSLSDCSLQSHFRAHQHCIIPIFRLVKLWFKSFIWERNVHGMLDEDPGASEGKRWRSTSSGEKGPQRSRSFIEGCLKLKPEAWAVRREDQLSGGGQRLGQLKQRFMDHTFGGFAVGAICAAFGRRSSTNHSVRQETIWFLHSMKLQCNRGITCKAWDQVRAFWSYKDMWGLYK